MRLSSVLEELLRIPIGLNEEFAEIKPPFASPAGKMKMAVSLVSKIPTHKTYVEPFAGSGAVFFAKPRSDVEVLNDLDPDVSSTLKILSTLTRSELDHLISMDFAGDPLKYKQMFDSNPTSKVGKLYRFLYLTRFSINSGRGRGQFNPMRPRAPDFLVRRVPPCVERLKGVKIYSEDYESVCKRYDSPETFFFLDPPYAGYNALKGKVSEKSFDEQRFYEALKSLKGKWLLNYGTKGDLPTLLKQGGYKVKTETNRRSQLVRGTTPKTLTHIISSNY